MESGGRAELAEVGGEDMDDGVAGGAGGQAAAWQANGTATPQGSAPPTPPAGAACAVAPKEPGEDEEGFLTGLAVNARWAALFARVVNPKVWELRSTKASESRLYKSATT